MDRKIFINLAVKNLERSIDFFRELGFSFNPRFSDSTATCMVIAEDIAVMLLTEEKFRGFTPKPLCDSANSTEVLLSLTCRSRAEVDELVGKAVAAGGTIYSDPHDYGFMYSHGFQDLDGHIWELIYLDEKTLQQTSSRSL